MIYFKKNMYLTYFEVYKKCCYSMMSAVYSVHLSSTFVFRYLANLVKERDGFELVIEVRWYWFLERHQNNGRWILIGSLNLKLSWLNILWLLVLSFLKCCFSIIEWVWGFFSAWVYQCLFLVHPGQHEGPDQRCWLVGKTGKGTHINMSLI